MIASIPYHADEGVIKWPLKFALFLGSLALRLLYYTLRVRIDVDSETAFKKAGASILVIWHNRISMTPYIRTRFRGPYNIFGLVSKSKDGAFLSCFFRNFKIGTERGSSNKGGARAAINLIRHLRSGTDICITPDGPRGPKYKTKPGVMAICSKSEARIIFIRADLQSFWTLRSWDGFKIPKPFSHVVFHVTEFDNYESFKHNSDMMSYTDEQYADALLGA